MNNESRLLISDSIKDNVSQIEDEHINESMIPIFVLFRAGEKEGIVTILRSVDDSATQLKFSFSCNFSDSLGIFTKYESGNRRQFDAAVIEHMNETNQIDLSGLELIGVNVKDIDSDKQTSICEVLFKRDNI